jgi:hypothetical protein
MDQYERRAATHGRIARTTGLRFFRVLYPALVMDLGEDLWHESQNKRRVVNLDLLDVFFFLPCISFMFHLDLVGIGELGQPAYRLPGMDRSYAAWAGRARFLCLQNRCRALTHGIWAGGVFLFCLSGIFVTHCRVAFNGSCRHSLVLKMPLKPPMPHRYE